jgi:magnesium transporter
MTVIASYLYKDGRRKSEVSLADAKPPKAAAEFIWIGLHDPSAEEIAILQKNFDLHPLAVEDASNEHHVITVRLGSARAHSELREHTEASPQLLKQGPDYVLHAVLDFVVDGYLPIVQKIEDNVLEMERHMLVTFLEREQIRRLFRLRRQVILFQRVLLPTTEVASKLVHLDLPCLDAEAKPFFRDVFDHVNRVNAMLNGLREVIMSVFEASNLLEQQRQGVITRQLAAWAAILAVPTAIAGIYGMNFDNMPELKTQYGYFVVLGGIVSISGFLYWRFKKSRWL